MRLVQLLRLSNQLILGGDVDSAAALENPYNDLKLITKIYT